MGFQAAKFRLPDDRSVFHQVHPYAVRHRRSRLLESFENPQGASVEQLGHFLPRGSIHFEWGNRSRRSQIPKSRKLDVKPRQGLQEVHKPPHPAPRAHRGPIFEFIGVHSFRKIRMQNDSEFLRRFYRHMRVSTGASEIYGQTILRESVVRRSFGKKEL